MAEERECGLLGSHCGAQAGLQVQRASGLTVSQPPERQDYRYVPPWPAEMFS